MANQKKLTFIIVTYNSQNVISKCLSKINLDNYDVIVVDNNSSDSTTIMVEDNFPKVKLIKLDKNIGYGRANNIALKEIKSDYSLILNPDALISDDDIEKTLSILDKNSDIALAGVDLRNKKQHLFEQNKSYYIFTNFVSGAIMFIKMPIFRKIGFFDENIFLFFEDDEITDRSIKNGYKNIIIKPSNFSHDAGTSSQSNLRNIYKKAWHINGWSKCYWTKKQKNNIQAKFLALKICFLSFPKSFFYLLIFKFKKFVTTIAGFCGAFSFLIGRKSFNNNGTGRG